LPIGGVKEKVLAAHRAGIKTILLPRQNERELEEDVPPELREALTIHFVDTAEEVLSLALEPAAEPKARATGSRAAAAKGGSGPRAARGKSSSG
jgi:ATP-dependent Lon protease